MSYLAPARAVLVMRWTASEAMRPGEGRQAIKRVAEFGFLSCRRAGDV
jgi:hypothetical protein